MFKKTLKERLIDTYDKIIGTRQVVEQALRDRDKVAERIEPILALADCPRLLAAELTGRKLLEIEVEFGFLNATFDLMKNRMTEIEDIGREAMKLIKQMDYLEAMGSQIPTDNNGHTIEEVTEEQIVSIAALLEDVGYLRSEAKKHIMSLKPYLG